MSSLVLNTPSGFGLGLAAGLLWLAGMSAKPCAELHLEKVKPLGELRENGGAIGKCVAGGY